MSTSIRQPAQVEWFRDNVREERLRDMYRAVIVDASLKSILTVEWWSSNIWKLPFDEENQRPISLIIADVFPSMHCVNTQINAPDQQT